MEIFIPVTVQGFEALYSVSNMGRVRSEKSKKILKPTTDRYGYKYYIFCHNGKRKTVKEHRLVASAFLQNVENKPTVDHINGDKKDNRVENLKWATNKEQSNNPLTYAKLATRDDAETMRRMGAIRDFGRKPVRVYKNGEIVGEYKSLRIAANAVCVSPSKASMCANGKRNQVKGYVFAWM